MSADRTVIIDPEGDLIIRVGNEPKLEDKAQQDPASQAETDSAEISDAESEALYTDTEDEPEKLKFILSQKRSELLKGTTDFRVCSATLRRASPYFKAMLYGGFAEGQKPDDPQTTPWVVRLHDDDPIAMDILLHSMHGRYDKFNEVRDNDVETIYHILVAVDKYDLIGQVTPWARNWTIPQFEYEKLSAARREAKADAPLMDEELHTRVARALYVAWEIGDYRKFHRTLMEMAWNARLLPGSGLDGKESEELGSKKVSREESEVDEEEDKSKEESKEDSEEDSDKDSEEEPDSEEEEDQDLYVHGCENPPVHLNDAFEGCALPQAIIDSISVMRRRALGYVLNGTSSKRSILAWLSKPKCSQAKDQARPKKKARGGRSRPATRLQANLEQAEECEKLLEAHQKEMMQAFLDALPAESESRARVKELFARKSRHNYRHSPRHAEEVINNDLGARLAGGDMLDVAAAALKPLAGGHDRCARAAVESWAGELQRLSILWNERGISAAFMASGWLEPGFTRGMDAKRLRYGRRRRPETWAERSYDGPHPSLLEAPAPVTEVEGQGFGLGGRVVGRKRRRGD